MKKTISFLLIILVMICFGMPALAATEEPAVNQGSATLETEKEASLTVSYKGQTIACENGMIVEGDLTFLQLREISSIYGLEISWAKGEAEQKVIISDGKTRYQLVVDLKKNEAYGLDNKTYQVRVVNDSLYLPIHFYAQMVNCEVSWDAEKRILTLNNDKLKTGATYVEPGTPTVIYYKVMNLPEYTKTTAPTVSRSEGFQSRGEIYQTGIASYYSKNLDGCKTASGERYRASEPVAAHKTLPFGTVVRVTALWSGETVDVRIIDRGPYVSGRVIDLSYSSATQLNMLGKGIGPVTLEILYVPPGKTIK